ncbi:MAG: hypothetical protein U0K68_10955 [Agathobacter sp.]|nr:hypothetical protein [Agathobacter sp.]
MAQWDTAERIAQEIKFPQEKKRKKEENEEKEVKVLFYEKQIAKHKKIYRRVLRKMYLSINIKAIFSLLLFFAINYGLNLCQESLPFSQNTVFGSFAYSLIVMGIFCILGSFINKFTKTPDILDIFHNFRTNAKDWFYSRKNVKNHTYYCKLHDK